MQKFFSICDSRQRNGVFKKSWQPCMLYTRQRNHICRHWWQMRLVCFNFKAKSARSPRSQPSVLCSA